MSCIPFVKKLLKFGQKIRKMASELKHYSFKYNKIEEPEFDISALVDEFDMKSETASSSGCSGFSFGESSDKSISTNNNLKILHEEQEKKNFEKMMCDFSSVYVGHDYVRVPPRDPWEDLVFPDKDNKGYEEQVFFDPIHQEVSQDFASPTFSDFSKNSYTHNSYVYSPLSSFGSYSSLSEQSFGSSSNNLGSPSSVNEGFYFPTSQEFTPTEFNEHLNKTEVLSAFSPSIASTPLAQRQLNFLLFAEMEVTDVIDQWNSFLMTQADYQKTVGFNMNFNHTENLNFESKKENVGEITEREVKRRKIKPHKKSLENFCGFCKNNGEPEAIYRFHTVRDAKGRVLCPKLRVYKCPVCGKDGDDAHTMKYCPHKKIFNYEDMKRIEEKNKLKKGVRDHNNNVVIVT